MLGPYDAVNGFGGGVPDGAARECLGCWFWLALIALTLTLKKEGGKVGRGWKWEGLTLEITVTCPRYPALPLSMRVTFAARQRRFT